MTECQKIYELTKYLTILFIEDDRSFREETKEAFDDIFGRVDIAVDGEDGLVQYQKNSKNYDLVITDLNLPKLDGVEVIKKIYEIDPCQQIIVLSAHNDAEYLFKLVNIGIVQFLVKPIEFDKALVLFYEMALKLKVEYSSIVTLSENYSFDNKKMVLLKRDVEVKLTKNELNLLILFIKNKNDVTSTDEMLVNIWDELYEFATIENLKPLISKLRRKLPENSIENVYGLGYKLLIDM